MKKEDIAKIQDILKDIGKFENIFNIKEDINQEDKKTIIKNKLKHMENLEDIGKASQIQWKENSKEDRSNLSKKEIKDMEHINVSGKFIQLIMLILPRI